MEHLQHIYCAPGHRGASEPCRRVVIAGTHSGVGKTSTALAVAAALARRGLAVAPFKVGPDYLDPTHLSRAVGRTCYNLDAWMCGEAYVRALFDRVCATADVAVIEGVMGLFDGADAIGLAGSTAEIALLLDAPALLVADAHGAAQSFAALVHGFTTFDARVRIAGVIANRVGSDGHARLLSDALDARSLPPLVGAIPKGGYPTLPSRHLGLVSADAHTLSPAVLTALADAFDRFVDISKIVDTAPKRDRSVVSATGRTEPRKRPRLGVASDAAFHFYYADNLEALEAAGCEIVRFSPLEDRALPPGLSGLYLGGGYPEVHAAALSRNKTMLAEIRAFSDANRPILAECGGLMYLSKGIVDCDGKAYPLAGLLPSWCRMRKTGMRLGYAEITLKGDSLLGARGDTFRGHAFHYSELVEDPCAQSDWVRVYRCASCRGREIEAEGFSRGMTLASYVHLHFASKDGAAKRFVRLLEETMEASHDG